MRKIATIINLVILTLFGYISYGKGVDENTAKKIGSNFLISVGVNGVESPSDLAKAYVASATVRGALITDYYVFNITGHNGFVMVSGDDLIEPILAYSNESSFDIVNISPAAKRWIEGYQNEITYVIDNNLPAQAGTPEAWNNLKVANRGVGAKTTVVTPLLTTKWDQGTYYNYKCPGSGSTKSYTGCVATAMAQVMKFWNWPTVGTGSHTYIPATNGGLYGAQTADFGNTAYNWAGMPNSITSNNSPAALLIYHAGVGTDMDYGYGSGGSGTYVTYDWSPILNCAEYAMVSYFHYKPTLQGLSRSATPGGKPAIPQTTWINDLKTELDAHRPVLYSGQEASGGGHCWVADGYDASDKMHFNWGWSGTGPDGYYSVNSIAPPALGYGGGSGNFNNDQCIVVGIIPDSFPSTPGNIKMLAHLNITASSPIQYNTGFSIVTKIQNGNSTTFNGDLCAQVFDKSNNLIGTMQTITGQTIAAGDSSASLTFSTTGMLNMLPWYSYYMRIMYRPTGTTTWTAAANNGTFINYNQLDVMNSQNIRLYDSISVGSHTILRGSPLTITTKIANLGTANFSGNFQAVLINISTGISYTVKQLTGQSLTASHFNNYTFSSAAITAPGGSYILAIQHQSGGTGPVVTTGSDYYLNPIYFTIVTGVNIDPVSLDADKIVVFPNPATNEVFIDFKGAGVNVITISDISGREVRTITVPDNQSRISIPVNDFVPGVYFAQLHSGNEVVTKKIVITR